jgi:hypothetical protein
VSEIHVFIVSAALALFIALVTSALQIAGVISVNVARLLLVGAWAVAVLGVCGSLQNAPAKHLLIAAVATGIPVGIGLIVLERWITRKVSTKAAANKSGDEIKLSQPERQSRNEKLKPATEWDYTEDEFYDVIWRWHYKPPSQIPRDIRPYCPECLYENEMEHRLIFPERSPYPPYEQRAPYLKLWCPRHSQIYQAEHIPNMNLDDFSKIRNLVQEKLENGSWREVVSRESQI